MNFHGNRNGGSVQKKPTITKRTVQVAAPRPSPQPVQRAPPGNRFQLSQNKKLDQKKPANSAQAKPTKTVAKHAINRGVKRKSATPDRIVFSDEEEDDNDSSDVAASDSEASRKRQKSSRSSVETDEGPRRRLVLQQAFEDNGDPFDFIHGADATSGPYAQKFTNPWEQDDFSVVELQYPSKSKRERFELKWPKNDSDDYKPMEDILATIDTICTYYLPEEMGKKYTDDLTGFGRRFRLAFTKQSVEEWISIVEEFNSMLQPLIQDGTVKKELAQTTELQLDWIKRILDQIFVRTVSPKAEKLNAYKNGSDNVYGELFPRFISDIFKKTGLKHDQVFIDLGSGVGNVTLQAALEVGCESWGIEMMPNPCDLAELQAKEFTARTKLWGLDVGPVNLLRGDMTSHPEVPNILQRADVVLVNNQAFTPALNDKLRDMFLDLKPGAKVVSLKPFRPLGHKIAARNVDSVVNQFVQDQYEYFSDSVSWSYYGNAHWYIATKDLGPLNRFLKDHGMDGS
ncbi:DOT1-domain-containing protein [Hortaea werneckii]|nr:DOT1-domain-containing protein [Hortaea werneckii]KAI6989231.1 DOT1-domain-containing protein [Hortaea werneckii]KAI7142967.1 DOT1-domain-containing protein [Hortaea werneckii]KAI7170459.1 DOT1-domain-containing protein [Hortaea werneckii]